MARFLHQVDLVLLSFNLCFELIDSVLVHHLLVVELHLHRVERSYLHWLVDHAKCRVQLRSRINERRVHFHLIDLVLQLMNCVLVILKAFLVK